MRFHLPKPLHGWRAFAGEVGIIVLGVLIALGAGQIVDAIHQRSDVAQLRAALNAELADDRARWENIRAGDACTLRRLDALDHWLATAPPDARLKHAYMPFLWNTHTSAWDSAKSTPAGQLIELEERLTYASLYEGLDNWRRINDDEIGLAATISADFATANQPENRREIPKLLVHARGYLATRQRNYPYFFTRFDELNIRPDSSKFTLSANPKALCAPLAS